MTDNERLARWQGKCYHVSDWGQTTCKYCGRTNDPRYFDFDRINPNYLTDLAAMSLLDTLIEKGYGWDLRTCINPIESLVSYQFMLTPPSMHYPNENSICSEANTRREAVVAAVLELIEMGDI